ncbi:AMP-binding protein [Oceanobacillus sp. Castelsardo]|uniref:AMP-binding protein n=1 Tax=Oceanobacillus sp. Castelsardo TaxID=1851204 RepID=UPI0008380187|nr:AMP-binding protein [Oceanobacillus sp. Castelsardo]
MKEVLIKSWPKELSETLNYRLGEKPLHEYLIQNAIDFPNQPGYLYYGNTITWKQLSDDTRKFASFLQSKGIGKGDRVALYMQNCPQYLIGHYAIQMLGAIVVPLNPMYKSSELIYFISEAEIKAIISAQELYHHIESIKSETPSLQFIVTTNYTDLLPEQLTLPIPEELKTERKFINNTYDMTNMIQSTDPLSKAEEIDIWDDVGLLVFTSGTTGRPKAAMLTYGNALFKTAATVHSYGLGNKDRTLANAPLCHIAGMVMGVNIPVYEALFCVLFSRFDTEATIQAIEKYKITKFYSVATMNAAILDYPGIETRELSSLELNFATSFGMKVDEKLANAWKKLTNGCVLLEASYGLSETHTCDTFMPMDKIKFGSCGIATYDTEFRIIDTETGEGLPPGKQGEIAVKNPGVFKGYLNRPEATAETLRDGWVYTGDIGMIDEDGYLYFQGRVKEMIKSSGFSIFPEDVEALMSDHEAISQIACIGVPDPKRGESVKAFVVLKPNYKGKISEAQMVDWAKEKMAAYKYPRFIEFIDHLPATSSGKVLRRLLKE